MAENNQEIKDLEQKITDLKLVNKDLLNQKNDNDIKIRNYVHQIELLKYGKEPDCANCRYIIGLDFSLEGSHNLCGNLDAAAAGCCTCCNRSCTKFKPDTALTSYVKKHFGTGVISWGKADAFNQLSPVDLYEELEDNINSKNKLEIAKEIIRLVLVSEGLTWKE